MGPREGGAYRMSRGAGFRFGVLRTVAVVLALLLLWTPVSAAQSVAEPGPTAGAVDQGPVVGGVALKTTAVAGWPLHYDRDVPPAIVEHLRTGLEDALGAVPRLSGLRPLTTPLRIHLLANPQRFRHALQEVAGVRIELVGEQVGAYAIQRGDTMLLFFQRSEVADPAGALLSIAHELAHLAVREASRTRAVPQWFNEGYSAWLSQRVLAERYPGDAALQRAVDRAVVASALHRRIGLLAWSDLVSRTEFSRAGTEGWTFLSYGQSTLFVAWLAERHGGGALGTFLEAIGDGVSAGQAFQASMGPFALQASAFESSLAGLPAEFRSGLHALSSHVRAGQSAAFVVVGGEPHERLPSALRLETGREVRFEQSLDAAGFVALWLGGPTTASPGRLHLSINSPSLGRLEAELLVDPAAEPGPSPGPIPAPIQLPERVGLRLDAAYFWELAAAA